MLEIKGITAPVPAWQVLRPRIIESRFEALHGLTLSPLVGRNEEIEVLLHCWTHAKGGNGQVVLISGEPGLGKSRLTEALAGRINAEPHVRLRCFCSPYHQDSALFPFVDQLSRAAGFTFDEPPSLKLEKLGVLLARAAPLDEDRAFLTDLLSLPASKRYPLPNLSPQRRKERTLHALIHQLEGLTRQKPVVMVFEDAHWIDPTSRELLNLIVERVSDLPLLLIVTFRPEFRPTWVGEPHVTLLALNRLDRHDQTVLVKQIAEGKSLPGEVVSQIVDRTDGVPLFIEELTKSVLESDLLREDVDRYVLDRALSPFAVPTSLHDSLIARLDRLESVRPVAQIGAAIGREFSYTLLRAVSRLPSDELQGALTQLVSSELVFQRGKPPDAVYAFKHALVQDVIHGSLLRNSRQDLHARIAEELQIHSPDLMESQPELFALHYAEAGLIEKSIALWGKAGHSSAARSAMAEAVAQFQKGLDQLVLLPDTPERQRQELDFWSALGAALRFAKGQATPQMGRAYTRARELWERLGSPSEFLHIPYGESFYRIYRGELDVAQRLDEGLLRLSLQRNDAAGLVLGHASAGRTLIYAGRFAEARAHLEEVLTLYDPISHRSLGQQSGSHPRISAQGQLGISLFCLGFPDQALGHSNAAIAESRTLAHAPSVATSLALAARLLCLTGDNAALDQRLDQLIAVATEQGFPSYQAVGTVYRGWSKVMSGDVSGGLYLMRSGSRAHGATGAEFRISFHMALLAKACEIAQQVDEAVSLLDEALQVVERIGERWFAAELYRHKGQLLLRQGHSEAASELYCKALEIAEAQEAKLWQLRIAISLARLRRDQGRRSEGRGLLAPIYNWFTEGFNTQDLQRAKVLLDELSQSTDSPTAMRYRYQAETRGEDFCGETSCTPKLR